MIDIDEWCAPIPRRLRGRITVDPGPIFEAAYALDENRRHHWRPVAPCARVEVSFRDPGLDWRGKAYLDMNAGSEPLETAFRSWNWSREDEGDATRIHYDVAPREGAARHLALDCCADGSSATFEPGGLQRLAQTGWRVARSARTARDQPARIERTMEDTPFYSRSMLAYDRAGAPSRAIHESVDLDRFRSRIVQAMLPFRMPRWTR